MALFDFAEFEVAAEPPLADAGGDDASPATAPVDVTAVPVTAVSPSTADSSRW